MNTYSNKSLDWLDRLQITFIGGRSCAWISFTTGVGVAAVSFICRVFAKGSPFGPFTVDSTCGNLICLWLWLLCVVITCVQARYSLTMRGRVTVAATVTDHRLPIKKAVSGSVPFLKVKRRSSFSLVSRAHPCTTTFAAVTPFSPFSPLCVEFWWTD